MVDAIPASISGNGVSGQVMQNVDIKVSIDMHVLVYNKIS